MSELRLPTDLRTEAAVSDDISRRTVNAARALLATFEAATQTEDVDERCLRLADVGFMAARGHNELRTLYLLRCGRILGASESVAPAPACPCGPDRCHRFRDRAAGG